MYIKSHPTIYVSFIFRLELTTISADYLRHEVFRENTNQNSTNIYLSLLLRRHPAADDGPAPSPHGVELLLEVFKEEDERLAVHHEAKRPVVVASFPAFNESSG